MVALILFALAGVGFGFAAPGRAKLIPLLFPLPFAIFALAVYGLSGWILLRVVIALLLTAGGILLGRVLEERFGGEGAAA